MNLASSILQGLLDSCRQKGKHMKQIFKYISENASLRSEAPEQFERFVTDFQTWQKQMKEVEEDFKRVKVFLIL